MSKKNEPAEADKEYLIPLPEDVLDPSKLYTRSDIFDFSKRGARPND